MAPSSNSLARQTRPFHIRLASYACGLVSPQDHPEDRLLPISRTCPAICDTTRPFLCDTVPVFQDREAQSRPLCEVFRGPLPASLAPTRSPCPSLWALTPAPSTGQAPPGHQWTKMAAGCSGSLLMHWVCLATTGPALRHLRPSSGPPDWWAKGGPPPTLSGLLLMDSSVPTWA